VSPPYLKIESPQITHKPPIQILKSNKKSEIKIKTKTFTAEKFQSAKPRIAREFIVGISMITVFDNPPYILLSRYRFLFRVQKGLIVEGSSVHCGLDSSGRAWNESRRSG
jgi:hypothetical protein